MKILVVIDVQNDFIDGALRNEEAIKRVPNIVNEIYEYGADAIFLTRDTHSANYLETMEGKKLSCPHCIANTKGWEIHPDVMKMIETRSSVIKIIDKYTFGYDNWKAELLEYDNDDETEVEIIGYCTDICVISNALAIKAVLPNAKIQVKESCCAGVSKQGHDEALRAMQRCHIDII